MEKGKDVSEGGAKYNSYGGTATGLATTADSLTALKYIVYDKKIATREEFLQAILDNWEGHEELRQIVLNTVPHYGNNDPNDQSNKTDHQKNGSPQRSPFFIRMIVLFFTQPLLFL